MGSPAEDAGADPDDDGWPLPESDVVERSDGLAVSYATYGDPGGYPVLFEHGIPGSQILGRLFRPVAEDLGVLVVAPERPGYGDSDPAPEADLAGRADATATPLEAAGVEAFGVVGFAGGGPAALSVGADPRASGVAVVDPPVPPSLDRPEGVYERLRAAAGDAVDAAVRRFFTIGGTPPESPFGPSAFSGSPTAPRFDVEGVDVGDVIREDVQRGREGPTDAAARERALLDSPWGIDFGAVGTPVALLYGDEEDGPSGRSVREFAGQFPRGTVGWVAGEDHASTLVGVRETALRYVVPDLELADPPGDR